MHVSLDWDNPEKTILRVTLSDGWTWEDLNQINPVSLMLMRESDHTVYLLIDMTHTRDFPPGGMAYAADLTPRIPPTLGMVLVVTHEILAQRMVNVLRAVFPNELAAKILSVDSFETAYAKIAAAESSEG